MEAATLVVSNQKSFEEVLQAERAFDNALDTARDMLALKTFGTIGYDAYISWVLGAETPSSIVLES